MNLSMAGESDCGVSDYRVRSYNDFQVLFYLFIYTSTYLFEGQSDQNSQKF